MFQIKDLKPGKARAVLNEAALTFQQQGVDPKEILLHSERFEGELADVNGIPTLIFTVHYGTLYYGCQVSAKHLKRGRKMKGA